MPMATWHRLNVLAGASLVAMTVLANFILIQAYEQRLAAAAAPQERNEALGSSKPSVILASWTSPRTWLWPSPTSSVTARQPGTSRKRAIRPKLLRRLKTGLTRSNR